MQFAIDNQLMPADAVFTPLPRAITRQGAEGMMTSNAFELMLDNGATCQVYDYKYTVGSGRSEETYYFSVLTFPVQATFPQLFLDSRKSHVSTEFAASQKLQLEGDFNDYFDLYAPIGEQIDVLSVLSPDVMQSLVDMGTPYDIALEGTNVFICSKQHFYTSAGLPHALAFASKLDDELSQRSVSWQGALPGTPTAAIKVAFWRTNVGTITFALSALLLFIVAIVASSL
jgi:hypothetical protein